MSCTGLIGLCRDLAPRGVALFLQSGLVLLAGLGLAFLLRRHGPFVQSLVLRATLAAVMLTAFLSAFSAPYAHPLWHVSLFGGDPAPSSHIVPDVMPAPRLPRRVRLDLMPLPLPTSDGHPTVPKGMPLPTSSAGIKTVAPAEASVSRRRNPSLSDWLCPMLVIAWSAGTVCLLLWTIAGQISLIVLHRGSVHVRAGRVPELLQQFCPMRPVPVRASPHIRSPFLGGLWRPTIYLPAACDVDFDGPTLRAILAHEAAHRDRCDNAWLLLTRLVCAVLWVQPLCWVLARYMEQISEEACDALVLQSGCPPHIYADCLLSLTQSLMPSRLERTFGASVVPLHSALGRRVQRILRKDFPIMSTLSPRLRLAVTLGIFFSGLSATLLVSGGATSARQIDGGPPQRDKAASECAAHLQAITEAVTRYAQDHQGHLPNGRTWADDIMPYVKDPSIFHDPGAHPTLRWSYAYNQNLSGALLDQIHDPSQIVVVYDSESMAVLVPVAGLKNASNPGDALPRPSRHQGFNLFGFLDGHTQTLPAGQKPSFKVAPTHQAVAGSIYYGPDPAILARQVEKMKQDWLDFKQAHPLTLTQAQIAQINRLISLRLQRNGLDEGIRMNAVVTAKHEARLKGLGPTLETERRYRRTQIRSLATQTLQWQTEMPKVEQQIIRQEALVQLFSDDYLETQYKRQQYGTFRSIEAMQMNAKAFLWDGRKRDLPTHPLDNRPLPERSARPVGVTTQTSVTTPGPAAESDATRQKTIAAMTQYRDKIQDKLLAGRVSLATYHQRLEKGLHQAFPSADPQTFARALKIERDIGLYTSRLQTTRYVTRHWASRQAPKWKAEDRERIAEDEGHLVPLLAAERQLIPGDGAVQQQLASVHTLAVQCREREIEVMGFQIELMVFTRDIAQMQEHIGH